MRAMQRVLAATAASMLVAAPAFAADAVRPSSSIVSVKAGQKVAPRTAVRKSAKLDNANQAASGVVVGVLAAVAIGGGIAVASSGGSNAVSP